jgi:hypothetical protein
MNHGRRTIKKSNETSFLLQLPPRSQASHLKPYLGAKTANQPTNPYMIISWSILAKFHTILKLQRFEQARSKFLWQHADSFIHSHRGIANAACPYVASLGLYQSAVIHSFICHVPETWLLISFDSEAATRGHKIIPRHLAGCSLD